MIVKHHTTCRDNKRDLREMNTFNNLEQETAQTQGGSAPPGVEESQTNQHQAELIPSSPIQSNLSSVINVTNQSVNSLGEYPINAIATSQEIPPDLRDNDHQIVSGVTPSTNGATLSTQASVNNNPDTDDDEHVADPQPCLCDTSPNHVPVPIDNRNAMVNAVPLCDTNDQQSISDLVRPPAPWPNLVQSHNSRQSNVSIGLIPKL